MRKLIAVFFEKLVMEAGIQCSSRRFYYGVQCKGEKRRDGRKKGRGKKKLAALDTIHLSMNESKATRKLGEGDVADDGHVVVNEEES